MASWAFGSSMICLTFMMDSERLEPLLRSECLFSKGHINSILCNWMFYYFIDDGWYRWSRKGSDHIIVHELSTNDLNITKLHVLNIYLNPEGSDHRRLFIEYIGIYMDPEGSDHRRLFTEYIGIYMNPEGSDHRRLFIKYLWIYMVPEGLGSKESNNCVHIISTLSSWMFCCVIVCIGFRWRRKGSDYRCPFIEYNLL